MHAAYTAKAKNTLVNLPRLLKRAFRILNQNDPLRMAGATAFFTSFALPFILLLVTQFLGLLVEPRKIRREVFHNLSGILGEQSTRQVVSTLVAFRKLASNVWIACFGILFLLLVSTTLLMVIKGSINQLWRIRMLRGGGFGRRLRIRLQSVLIIVATGILILVSLLTETAQAFLGKTFTALFPAWAHYINSLLNHLLSLVFVTLWFGLLFRLLPDGRPLWRVAFSGAFLTAILFTIGRYVLRLLLINSNIGSLYGASASAVLILLFVFYSSFILYFGAAFTDVWANFLEKSIKPKTYAVHYRLATVKEEQTVSE